jgi:hypothetical protein
MKEMGADEEVLLPAWTYPAAISAVIARIIIILVVWMRNIVLRPNAS